MSLFNSMFDQMDSKHLDLMEENQELLKDMLDFAIEQLTDIASTNEIYLTDNGKICDNYESIFNCLKHWALLRNEK